MSQKKRFVKLIKSIPNHNYYRPQKIIDQIPNTSHLKKFICLVYFFFLFFSDFHKIWLKKSSRGSKNNQKKILCSLRDISGKMVFWVSKVLHPSVPIQARSACIGMDGWMEYFLKLKKPCFSEISRKLPNIFFWLFLLPLEDFLSHLLWKSQQKKTENKIR